MPTGEEHTVGKGRHQLEDGPRAQVRAPRDVETRKIVLLHEFRIVGCVYHIGETSRPSLSNDGCGCRKAKADLVSNIKSVTAGSGILPLESSVDHT